MIYPDIDVIVDPARAYSRPLVDDVPVEGHPHRDPPYRDVAAKFTLEDFELEALIRPHLRPPAFRRAPQFEPPAEALL
ncbi:hypothetical protein ACFV9C_00355 [Kribbella sp. NPDC059898]|uniref:hypothetical protein n=1 Tax=Kribbella sp. NPDC059898 TaxID=3346995 RepID=UPI00364DFA95